MVLSLIKNPQNNKTGKPDGVAWKQKRKLWLDGLVLRRVKRWKVKRRRTAAKRNVKAYRSHEILPWERQRKLQANSSLRRSSNKASQGILYLS